mmetsp:Transcript_9574/g.13568  ORF Transcript_9574/g.13568 Transcript_9574/m.13568 type:complete len:411 (-) Transcript_9574:232-1464(-)
MPSHIVALYFVLVVCTPGLTFEDVRSARASLIDMNTEMGICHFVPSMKGTSTAMFLMRISRHVRNDHSTTSTSPSPWTISIIEDSHPSARDFGHLIPHIKSYTRDIIPQIRVNPYERVAIMRKSGTIRLSDYTHLGDNGNISPEMLVFGLAWDVTEGVKIDLDASVICLGSDLDLLDIVNFSELQSKDGAICHGGDELTGDTVGDDEQIFFKLKHISPAIKYIVFVINSYSGQELDDVTRASCHLFPLTPMHHHHHYQQQQQQQQQQHQQQHPMQPSYDHTTSTSLINDIASYHMTNCSYLDKHTALILACLYRDDAQPNNWLLNIISEPARGRVAKALVPNVQDILRTNPPPQNIQSQEEEEEIVVSPFMPDHVPMEEDIVIEPSIPIHQMTRLHTHDDDIIVEPNIGK